MNNDLISRSALQEAYNEECIGECGCCKHVRHSPNGTDGCALIDDAPAVDAVPVVRCKDCKFFKWGDYCMHDGKMEHSQARPDDYCSYGERRDGDVEDNGGVEDDD